MYTEADDESDIGDEDNDDMYDSDIEDEDEIVEYVDSDGEEEELEDIEVIVMFF